MNIAAESHWTYQAKYLKDRTPFLIGLYIALYNTGFSAPHPGCFLTEKGFGIIYFCTCACMVLLSSATGVNFILGFVSFKSGFPFIYLRNMAF